MAVLLTDDFTGSNNSQVKDRPDWQVLLDSAADGPHTAFRCDGAGFAKWISTQYNSPNFCVLGVDTGSVNHKITVKGSNTASSTFGIMLRCSEVNPRNGVVISTHTTGINIWAYVNNTAVASTSNSFPSRTDSVFTYSIENDLLTITRTSPSHGEETIRSNWSVAGVPDSGTSAGVINVWPGLYDEITIENDLEEGSFNSTVGFFSLI